MDGYINPFCKENKLTDDKGPTTAEIYWLHSQDKKTRTKLNGWLL